MPEFFTFFVILAAGLLFSEAFNRLHLPWVTALIVSGILFGPDGFDMINGNAVTDFFSETGLVFLMFMAGLEINFKSFKRVGKPVAILTIINGVAPFFTALLIGYFFNLSGTATFLLAATLVSSSIAVIFPSLEGTDILKRRLGKTIIASTVILDIVSVTLFSVFIQQVAETRLPMPVVYIFLAVTLVLLRLSVPKLERYLARRDRQKLEQELQLIIGVLIGTVVLFGLLGLHPAEAGFFAGLVLSDSVTSSVVKTKLHAMAYGLFIPVFFVMVGAEIDLGVFNNNEDVLWLTSAVVGGSIITKFASGWFGGRLSGFTNRESALIGVSTIPQLNVTLAVAVTAYGFALIDQNMLTALISLTVVTTLLAPPLIARFSTVAKKV